MGIPSYFSYIIKNHPTTIKKHDVIKNISNFYLDSNSIIYDALQNIEFNENTAKYENELIAYVIKKIQELIKTIKPSKNVLIAFDGVAPIAKLQQQKTRRYKSMYINKIIDKLEINSDNDNIKSILHNLFYDIMNIEFNLWPWTRNMCKYGDFFLKLEIAEKFGVYNVIPYTSMHDRYSKIYLHFHPYYVPQSQEGHDEQFLHCYEYTLVHYYTKCYYFHQNHNTMNKFQMDHVQYKTYHHMS